jgi:hypothetical protein
LLYFFFSGSGCFASVESMPEIMWQHNDMRVTTT